MWRCAFCDSACRLPQILWTFSIYLEAVAILPQLFMISKTGEAETITTHYLFFSGSVPCPLPHQLDLALLLRGFLWHDRHRGRRGPDHPLTATSSTFTSPKVSGHLGRVRPGALEVRDDVRVLDASKRPPPSADVYNAFIRPQSVSIDYWLMYIAYFSFCLYINFLLKKKELTSHAGLNGLMPSMLFLCSYVVYFLKVRSSYKPAVAVAPCLVMFLPVVCVPSSLSVLKGKKLSLPA